MYGAGFRLLLLLCCFRLGQILGRDTFSGICDDIRSARYLGYLHIAHETVMNHRNHMIKTLSVLLGVSGIKMSLMVRQTFQDKLN